MTAESADPRSVRSRGALIAAMTALLDAAPLEQVTITQLVQSAGVSRPTFYQHYADVAELASDAAIMRLDTEFVRNEPVASPRGWLATVEPVVRRLLAHLAEHRDFYRRVFLGPSARSVMDAAVDLVARRILERSPLGQAIAKDGSGEGTEEVRDRVVVVSGGIVWLLTKWPGTDLTGTNASEAMAHRISVQLVRLAPTKIGEPPVGIEPTTFSLRVRRSAD